MWPTRLRCEYLIDPVGIDAVTPRLSWVLQSEERGQRQTAWQVLVGSRPDVLSEDRGDLWDSGKVDSDRTSHVEYAGGPLVSRMRCFWKVRVWDKVGRPSRWSDVAQWSMGLLARGDWEAQWIAYDDPAPPPPMDRHYGYLSRLGKSADEGKWVQIDLGEDHTIDTVHLYPARPIAQALGFPVYGWQPSSPGFLFPIRFRIEAARNADFSDGELVVDRTLVDVPNPGLDAQIHRFAPIAARFVRLTVTRMVDRVGGNFGFALAEMEVYAGSRNVAKDAAVTAFDSVETGGWSKAYLVDGRRGDGEGIDELFEWPATMVRKEFAIRGPVKRAAVSVTGLGLYELRINGRKVGDHILAPEWTRYQNRIQYQTYNVTDLLHEGLNAVGAQMNGGWWTGPITVETVLKDPRFCLLMRLDIEVADGSTQTIVTDQSWQATNDGPIRRAGIYFGETYDGTKEMLGWDEPGFVAAGWSPVRVLPHADQSERAGLVGQCNEPIRVVRELRPVQITEPMPGVYVFDLGQNMAGWCRLKADAPRGARITVRHAEVLNEDGTLCTANLRGAAQVNEYIWPGGQRELEPHFTYHGFRYVEVTGLTAPPDEDTLLGRVFHSSARDSGEFSCSNELINRIMHCVQWVQRANMPSVPTDCPQRTERMGFTGDILAFSQTAIYNMDMAGFFTKWIPDLRDSQLEDGRFPNLAPHPADMEWLRWTNVEFVPAWSDAGVVIPWRVYLNYGDRRILEEQYEAARRWVEFVRSRNPDHLWRNDRGGDYGDWLHGDMTNLEDYPRGVSAMPLEAFATAFYADSARTLARMAGVLDRKDEAVGYTRLFEDIKVAFCRRYVDADGRIEGDTQGGYALALQLDLIDESLRPKATEHLVEAIRQYKDHLSTGFLTTHLAMLVLSRYGRHSEAYRLINLRTVPSWGYMVERGATTIWERWDGYVAERGFQSPNMNSFSHWAFGSVGEWVWRELAGINPDESCPGYQHFVIRPRPCGDLRWVKARYDSIRGPIVCEWRIVDGRFELEVEVPANTTATVHVPATRPEAVTEGAGPAAKAEGVRFIGIDGSAAVFGVESGRYRFQSERHGECA
ncbi:MAG: family 78 glycoside hydrolase catalytic domain [Phycisphaerae bacterium]|nr:family 78 glycoside hydrolase catalytic domain [Phycisphaerae bacterium]